MSISYSFHLSYSKPPRIIRHGPGASWGLGTSTQLSVPCDRRGWVTSAHSAPRLGHSRVSVLSVIVLMPHGSLKDPMFDLSYFPLFQVSFLSKHSDFPLKWIYFVVILNALANKNICNELSQMFFFFNSASTLNSNKL